MRILFDHIRFGKQAIRHPAFCGYGTFAVSFLMYVTAKVASENPILSSGFVTFSYVKTSER